MKVIRSAPQLPRLGLFITSCLISLMILQGCAPSASTQGLPLDPSQSLPHETQEPSPTFTIKATNTIIPAGTETPTPQNCAWTWTYAEGSPELDDTAQKELSVLGITAVVHSTSYGEINSCDNSFHPMCLDFTLEVQTDDLKDLNQLASQASIIAQVLDENLNTADVTIICSTEITFISGEESITCTWDEGTLTCAE